MRNIYTLESIRSVAERTLTIISEITGTPYNKLKSNMDLRKDLELDEEFGVTTLITSLEEEFDINIPYEHGKKWKTIGDILFYISRRLSGYKS